MKLPRLIYSAFFLGTLGANTPAFSAQQCPRTLTPESVFHLLRTGSIHIKGKAYTFPAIPGHPVILKHEDSLDPRDWKKLEASPQELEKHFQSLKRTLNKPLILDENATKKYSSSQQHLCYYSIPPLAERAKRAFARWGKKHPLENFSKLVIQSR